MSTQSTLAYMGLIVANVCWGPDKGSRVCVDAMLTTDIEIISATTIRLVAIFFSLASIAGVILFVLRPSFHLAYYVHE